jgi:hypothetical protein
MRDRSHFIRNAAIAALAGSTIGAGAGLWSVRDRTTTSVSLAPTSRGGDVVASSAPAATEARASAALGRPGVTPPDRPAPAMAVATNGVARPAAPAAAVPADSARDDRQSVLQQARVLAERPDVKALVALRDRISRQAGERGDQESAATQQLLREIERYLAEARRLRLKLDGDDLRKLQLANRPPTGR